MKKVVIKKLTLKNFRGIKDLGINFNEHETFVSGENSTGKSTIFNSFCWLLFGKDKEDRKDFNIRPIINGELLRRVDCEVIGDFLIDGEEISLRRIFKEKWVKPRGEANEVFKGNETETLWNDVPVNITEYQRRISEIFLNESIFKMVTNPLYFPQLKWQDQREQLFQLARTITDHEVAAKNPEYATLLDKITGKSLADFKREISTRKKKLKDELDMVQPRIDQTHKLMPETADFNALEVEIESLENQIKDIDEAIADKTKAIRQQYQGVQKKQSEINELKQKRQQVLHEAKTTAKDSAFEANALRRNLESNIKALENEISIETRSVKSSESELESLKAKLTAKNEETTVLRQSWHDENAKEYTGGDDTCNECGQLLPEERRKNARNNFTESKATKLAKITQNGKRLSNEAEQIEQDVADSKKRLKTAINDLNGKNENLASLKRQLKEMAVVEESEIIPDELPEYTELTKQIQVLEESLENGTESIDTTELQAQKKEISAKRDSAKSELKNRDLIAQYNAEIKNLEDKGKQLAQQIADLEREEYVIQNFTKAKIDECERRINGLFTMVTFKLFEYTIENNEVETCIPLVNGVPFGTANSAGQVNAGIDIINALIKFHDVSAPIFIDGRESVNHLISTESQIINLVVSHDKELVIK